VRRILFSIVAGAVFCLAVGCAHRQPVAPFISRTALTVAQVGGSVTLSWPSQKGKTYKVLYSDTVGGQNWQVLPGSESLAGTGDFMSVTDEVAEGTSRFYRLRIDPPEMPE
jgi:hypothetical protein